MAIPIIDKRIKHVGPGTLRKMDALKLRGLRDLVVIQVDDEPLAVLIPYEMYLEMQKEVSEGDKAISRTMLGLGFRADGPVDVFPKPDPDDYAKLPAGVPYTVNDGTGHNPDMAYSKNSYIEPENERRKVPRSGSTLQIPPDGDVIVPGICQHCGGKAQDSGTLCQECFLAGHRAVANCQQCAERVK